MNVAEPAAEEDSERENDASDEDDDWCQNCRAQSARNCRISSHRWRSTATARCQGPSGKLDSACVTLSDASEALQTVHDAREALRKGGSKGGGKTTGKSGQSAGAKRRPKAQAVKISEKIRARMVASIRNACGKKGHGAGNPVRGSPHRETNVIGHADHADNGAGDGDDAVPIRDVWTTRPAGVRIIDSGMTVVDTACKFSVAGDAWYTDFKRLLEEHGLANQIVEEPEHERYRFGNGGARVPVVIGGKP